MSLRNPSLPMMILIFNLLLDHRTALGARNTQVEEPSQTSRLSLFFSSRILKFPNIIFPYLTGPWTAFLATPAQKRRGNQKILQKIHPETYSKEAASKSWEMKLERQCLMINSMNRIYLVADVLSSTSGVAQSSYPGVEINEASVVVRAGSGSESRLAAEKCQWK